MTLCIRYTLDANKLTDFEAYARAVRQPVERCGGKFIAYYLPTKIAGPTNTAFGLIDFPDLASYERYREKLLADPDGIESLRRAEAAGCILNEERSFVRRRVTEGTAHPCITLQKTPWRWATRTPWCMSPNRAARHSRNP